MLRFIPNILTFVRVALTIVFLTMILYSPPAGADNRIFFLNTAFAVFLIAGLTDVIDGPIARKLNVTSRFGRMVDPLADKVLVCGAFVCFAIIGEPKLFSLTGSVSAIIHWAVAGVLILREVYVTILRHIAEGRGINFAATFSGKIKMFLQSVAIAVVLIKMAYFQREVWAYWLASAVFALMLVVTVISGLRATKRHCWKQAAA